MLTVLNYKKQELITMRFTIFEEAVKFGIWRKWEGREIFLIGYKFNHLILFASLFLKANNFNLWIVGKEKILLAKTDMTIGRILEDVLDLCAGNLSIFDLNDIEPPGVVLSFVELKHEIFIENIPAHNVVYLIRNLK